MNYKSQEYIWTSCPDTGGGCAQRTGRHGNFSMSLGDPQDELSFIHVAGTSGRDRFSYLSTF